MPSHRSERRTRAFTHQPNSLKILLQETYPPVSSFASTAPRATARPSLDGKWEALRQIEYSLQYRERGHAWPRMWKANYFCMPVVFLGFVAPALTDFAFGYFMSIPTSS